MKKKIIHFFVLSCEKATLLMEKEFQGSLSLLERIQLMVHLAICKDCTCYRNKSHFLDSCIDKSATDFDADFTREEIEEFQTRLINLHKESVHKKESIFL